MTVDVVDHLPENNPICIWHSRASATFSSAQPLRTDPHLSDTIDPHYPSHSFCVAFITFVAHSLHASQSLVSLLTLARTKHNRLSAK